MILWHMLTKETNYIWVRPALLARKLRNVELKAGMPAEHAKRGDAYNYNIPERRAAERAQVEQAEQDYTRSISRWRSRPRGEAGPA